MIVATLADHGSIPARRTPIVGRDAEVAGLLALLARPEVRLVTLVGPGGVGKTRLALEVAHALRDGGAERVAFVPLAAASGPETVALEIARRLGLAPGQSVTIDEVILQLAGASIVLVIDNFEHVIDSAPLVARLLDGVAGVRLLVTSRAPLRLAGEREFPVDPLPVAGTDGAVRLFAERAAAVRPDFRVTDENRAVVAEICARLDGLPLAIELAAARLRVLSLDALHARLDRRLHVLGAGPRDAPARQQTLRDAIAWSYDLLLPAEQVLFRRLSVFAGSFTLEAAEGVVGAADANPTAGQAATPPLDAMDGVFSLVDQSLLRRIDVPGEDVRYLMLETIREFGREELGRSGEERAVAFAYARWYAERTVAASQAVKRPDGISRLRWIDRELVHVRAAAETLIALGEKAAAARLLGRISDWWAGRLTLVELDAWTDRIFALPGDLEPEDELMLELEATWVRLFQGQIEQAQHHADRASVLATVTGEPADRLRLQNLIGGLAYQTSQWERAAAEFGRAVELAETTGELSLLPSMLHNLGIARGITGDRAGAMRAFERGVEAARTAGNRLGEAICNLRLALTAFLDGDLLAAAGYNRAAIPILWESRHVIGLAEAIGFEALIAERQGDPDRARRYLTLSERSSAGLGIAEPPLPHAYAQLFLDMMDRLGLPHDIGAAGPPEPVTRDLIDDLLARPVPERAAPPDATPAPAVERPGEALGLTPREVEIVRLLAQGRSNQEIADELYISLRTAQTHVSNILTKLKVTSRAAVAAVAVRHGIA